MAAGELETHEAQIAQEQAEAFRSFVEHNDELITVVGRGGAFVYVNRAAERVFGIAQEQCLGRSAFDFVHPEDRARTVEAFQAWRAASASCSFSFENRQVSRSGEVRHMRWSITPCFGADGTLNCLASSARDVGATRRFEQELVQREVRLRALLAGMLDPVVTIDAFGIIQDASESVRSIFGYAPGEIVGQNVKLLMPEPHFSAHDGYLAHYRRTGETGIINRTREFEILRKDGTRLVCELSVSRVDPPGEDGPLFIGSFRDVTARVHAVRELHESEQRFRAIFDQEFQFVGLLRTDGMLVEVNQAALEAAGIARTEALGRPFWETAWWSHTPEAQELVRDAIGAAARGEFVRFETTHRRRSGELIAVDFSLKPVRDEAGRIVLLLPEGRDITKLKEAQRRETTMLHALASIGESASILAHEIKNPITAVNLALKAVAERLGEDHQEVLADLVQRLQKLERTMRRTLSFARPLELRRRPIVARALLEDAARSLRPELEQCGVALELRSEAELPAIEGDHELLEEVLANLIKNAREALGSGGHIWLSAVSREKHIELAVEDDGPGIPESALVNLFKPFHTTKAEGTGIGLALCKKIVVEHGGEITVGRSARGGARFAIRLPSVAAGDQPPPA